ncbi:MAG: membrane dipeptidase, partial [Acidobacteria bacterium]|nr:membrane dipeptidase [Candidatus Sulfomarinibacter kjeldsenii]
HPRNVPDDVLERLAENGGVVMLNFVSYFLDPAVTERNANRKAELARLEELFLGDPQEVEERMDRWYAENPVPTVPLAVAADHLDHIVKIAGIDNVGLGSDFDGIGSLPEGLEDVSGYPVLLGELLSRGWSREDLAKLAGLNVLRVMRQTERVASELQKNREPIEVLFEPTDSYPSED